MKFSFRKRLNQAGLLSLYALIPIVLAIVAVGGVGAYVVTKSKAATAGPSWKILKQQTGTYTVQVNKYFEAKKAASKLEYGKLHRICITAKSTGSSSKVVVNPVAFGGTMIFGKTSTTKCSKSYRAEADPYPNDSLVTTGTVFTPSLFVSSGYPNLTVTKVSFQVYK